MNNETRVSWERVTNRNVDRYLRKFASEIDLDELDMISPPSRDCIAYFYGKDSVLKVPKNEGSRERLLKEAKLLDYLADYDLSVVLPRVVRVHPEGFYAEYTRIKGTPLSVKGFETLSEKEKTAFVRDIGVFLSFLHEHAYPAAVTDCIPFEAHEVASGVERARNRVRFIQAHAPEMNVSRWIEHLHDPPMNFAPVAVAHRDFTFEHIYWTDDGEKKFGVIDFGCAAAHDPFIDFYELCVPESMVHLMLEHYDGRSEDIKKKVTLHFVLDEVRREYKRLRKVIAA